MPQRIPRQLQPKSAGEGKIRNKKENLHIWNQLQSGRDKWVRGAGGKGKDAAHTSYDRPKNGKSFSEQRRKVANITEDYGNPKTNRFHMQMRVGTIETVWKADFDLARSARR